MADLLKVQHDEWTKLRRELRDLQAQVRQVSLQPVAIVAASTQVYPTVAALPAGGRGMLATVDDDGTGNPALYWHSGTAWRRVTVV